MMTRIKAENVAVMPFVRSDWPAWIGKVPAFAELQDGRADAIIGFALEKNLLGEDGGVLHIGTETERRLGHRHFSELLSVVTSQPLFQVRFGRGGRGRGGGLTGSNGRSGWGGNRGGNRRFDFGRRSRRRGR